MSYSQALNAAQSASRQTIKPKRRTSPTTWAAVSLAIALIVGGVAWWKHRIPKPTDNPVKVAHFMATTRFAEMPADQKKAYEDAMRAIPRDQRQSVYQSLTEDERRNMWRNAGSGRRAQMISQWVNAKTPEDRTKLIDAMLDRMVAWQARAATRPAGQGGGWGGGPGGGGPGGAQRGTAAAQADRHQATTPQEQQIRMEIRAAMQQRAKDRGLNITFPPGRF